jgi:hypothetical protein
LPLMHKLLGVPLETWEKRGAERQNSNGLSCVSLDRWRI